MKKIRILALLTMLCLLAGTALAELRGGDTYVEPLSGATITLPGGWNQYDAETVDNESYFSMRPEDGKMYLIAFGATDLYAINPGLASTGVGRDSINNDLLDAYAAADIMEVDPSAVQYVEFENGAFFLAEDSFSDDSGEQCVSISAISYHNGYIYMACYMGYDHAYAEDLTLVLNSFRP